MGLWYKELNGAYKKTLERIKILSTFIFLFFSAASYQQWNSMTALHVLFIILWRGSHLLKYFAYKYNQHKCFFKAYF